MVGRFPAILLVLWPIAVISRAAKGSAGGSTGSGLGTGADRTMRGNNQAAPLTVGNSHIPLGSTRPIYQDPIQFARKSLQEWTINFVRPRDWTIQWVRRVPSSVPHSEALS